VNRHPDFKIIILYFLDQSKKAIHRKEILIEWYELLEFLIEQNGLEPGEI
jgi:hypothetical protein